MFYYKIHSMLYVNDESEDKFLYTDIEVLFYITYPLQYRIMGEKNVEIMPTELEFVRTAIFEIGVHKRANTRTQAGLA